MTGVRGSVVGWGTLLQAGRSRDRIPDEVDFFNLPNPSSRTMALGSTQPLTEMSTRNLPGGKGRPARKADNLTKMCEPIAYKNVEAPTSHSPIGLHGPLQGYLLPLPLYQDPESRWASGSMAAARYCSLPLTVQTDHPTSYPLGKAAVAWSWPLT
jgi:hypothetical protein